MVIVVVLEQPLSSKVYSTTFSGSSELQASIKGSSAESALYSQQIASEMPDSIWFVYVIRTFETP